MFCYLVIRDFVHRLAIQESLIAYQSDYNVLSKSSTYAIQACAQLVAKHRDKSFTPISELATELEIPYHFLKKVMSELVQHGIIVSQRSAKGGVALAKDPHATTLSEIITSLEGSSLFTECLLGLPGCGEKKPCAMHSAWAVERNRLQLMFTSTTIADVASRIQKNGYRIT